MGDASVHVNPHQHRRHGVDDVLKIAARPRQRPLRRLLPAQVVSHADEAVESRKFHLPHRQVHGEAGTVLAQALHLPPDADDVSLTRLQIAGQARLVPVAIR